MNARIIAHGSYKSAAWKNGLGVTSEIAIHPPTGSLKGGDFSWRLSSAEIRKASSFSEFPFHDRTLVILEGMGIRLFHTYEPGEEPEMVELPPLQPYDFPGDVPSRCELVSGPVTDLSIFARKGETEVAVDVLEVPAGEDVPWAPGGRWNFLFAVDGDFAITLGLASFDLARRDTFELTLDSPFAEGEMATIRSLGDEARLVTVSINGA